MPGRIGDGSDGRGIGPKIGDVAPEIGTTTGAPSETQAKSPNTDQRKPGRQQEGARSCFLTFDYKMLEGPRKKLTADELMRRASGLRGRLGDLSERFKDQELYQELYKKVIDAYWNGRTEGFEDLERSVAIFEEYARLLAAGERLIREFPTGLSNDLTFQRVQRENPDLSGKIENLFVNLGVGKVDSFKYPIPQTIEEMESALLFFATSDLDKFLDRMGREQGTILRYKDFGFKFVLQNSCVPEKPEAAEVRKTPKAAGKEKTEIADDDVRGLVARVGATTAIAKEIGLEDSPKDATLEVYSDRLKEVFNAIAEECERLGIKPDLPPVAFLPEDDSIIVPGEKLVRSIRATIKKIANLESMLFVADLKKEAASVCSVQCEPSVKDRLDSKIELIAGLLKKFESDKAMELVAELHAEIASNLTRLAIDQEIVLFSDPAGVIQKGHAFWKFATTIPWRPSPIAKMAPPPEYYKKAVARLEKIKKIYDSGDVEAARRQFDSFRSTLFHRKLEHFLMAYEGLEKAKTLTATLAIVAVSGMLSGLAVEGIAVAYPALKGTALGKVALGMVSGGSFLVGEKILKKIVLDEDPLPGETSAAKVKNLIVDWVAMSAMLGVLHHSMRYFGEITKGLLKYGVPGEVARYIANFLGEFGVFTVWEVFEGNVRLGIEGEIDPATVWHHVNSFEGHYNRAMFLAGLKVANFLMSPAFGPVGARFHRWAGEKRQARLIEIRKEAEGIIRAYRSIGVEHPEDLQALRDDVTRNDELSDIEKRQADALDSGFRRLQKLHREKIGILEGMKKSVPPDTAKQLDDALEREREALRETNDFFGAIQPVRQAGGRKRPASDRIVLEGLQARLEELNGKLEEHDRLAARRKSGGLLSDSEKEIIEKSESLVKKRDRLRAEIIKELEKQNRPQAVRRVQGENVTDIKPVSIRHDGASHRFYDLEDYVGVMSAGLRADSSGEHRVDMPSRFGDMLEGRGIEELNTVLRRRAVDVQSLNVRDDIYQTDDPNRSVVELASNGLDASEGNVKLTLRDGFYEVEDTGSGMDKGVISRKLLIPKLSGKPDPAKQIGRFGIGFYTVLRHLKANGDSVEVVTVTRDGEAHRLIFLMKGGRIIFSPERVSLDASDPVSKGGTRVRVKSADVKAGPMRAEIDKYLRLVNSGRYIILNGRQISNFDGYTPHPLSREGDYGKVYHNPKGPNAVTIKLGEIIIESYETAGNVPKGEFVIELPHGAGLSVTRDAAAIDSALYNFLKDVGGRATEIPELNLLARLYEEIDKRHDGESLVDLLRKRASGIVAEKHGGERIFPDTAGLRDALTTQDGAIFVHPELYNTEWLDRFETPREFISGEAVSAGGWKKPVRLVLCGDLKGTLYIDKDLGIIFLNKELYETRAGFVLSALFAVPGMDFNVRWSGDRAAQRGLEVFVGGDKGAETVIPAEAGIPGTSLDPRLRGDDKPVRAEPFDSQSVRAEPVEAPLTQADSVRAERVEAPLAQEMPVEGQTVETGESSADWLRAGEFVRPGEGRVPVETVWDRRDDPRVEKRDKPVLGERGDRIKEFVGRLGLTIEDFAQELQIPERFRNPDKWTVIPKGDNFYLVAGTPGKNGKFRIFDWNRRRPILELDENVIFENSSIEEHGGRVWIDIPVHMGNKIERRLYNDRGELITKGYQTAHIDEAGAGVIINTQGHAEGKADRLFRSDGSLIAEADSIQQKLPNVLGSYDDSGKHIGGRLWYDVVDGDRNYLYSSDGKVLVGRGIIFGAGGRSWPVMEVDGMRHLYSPDGKFLLAAPQISVKEAGDKAWITTRDFTSGKEKIYSEDLRFMAEGDAVRICDAAGQAWFVTYDLGEDGPRVTVKRGARELAVRGKMLNGGTAGAVSVKEAGGRAWIHLSYSDSTEEIYSEDGRLVAEGKELGVHDDGRRVWFSRKVDNRMEVRSGEKVFVMDVTNGIFSVLDIDGSIWITSSSKIAGHYTTALHRDGRLVIGVQEGGYIVTKRYAGKTYFFVNGVIDLLGGGPVGPLTMLINSDEKTIFGHVSVHEVGGKAWFVGGKAWFVGGNGVLHNDRFEPIVVGLAAGTVHVIQGEGGRFLIWGQADHARGTVLYSEDGPVIMPGELSFGYFGNNERMIAFGGGPSKAFGSSIPIDDLESVAGDPRLAKRAEEARRHRLSIPGVFYFLSHADDALWSAFMGDGRKRGLLGLITSPDAIAFVKANPDMNHQGLRDALLIMKNVSVPISIDTNTYVKRLGQLLRSGIDTGRLVEDLSSGKVTEDTEVANYYLTTRDSVSVGRSVVGNLAGESRSLADIITHLRLRGRSVGIEGAREAREYGNEEDRRQLDHAIHHLHATHPYIFVRELLQNSLDVQRVPERITSKDGHKIELDTFMEDGSLVVRVRDYGGMTEEEFVRLLLPGEGSKGKSIYRGGFGIGFYSAMAGAKWVRVKTAVAGSRKVIVAEFEVIRNADGTIKDIRIRLGKEDNVDNFAGTVVETARLSKSTLLDAAQIKTRMKDMGQYISRSEADVYVDGDLANEGRNGALLQVESKNIGTVSLYDGLSNRILVGSLPLTDLPASLWEGVPEGIRDYYKRRGFYINLDHRRVFPTLTRDRLENQEEVMAELGRLLPAMLIKGFLQRVTSAKHSEKMQELPEVYFIESYKLAERRILGGVNVRNAELINSGRLSEVDAGPYFDPKDGRRNLLALLTMVRFVKLEGVEGPLSLRDIHSTYQRALRGDTAARELLDKIRKSPLPKDITERLVIADRSEEGARVNRERVEAERAEGSGMIDDIRPDKIYGPDRIKSEAHKVYLGLLQRVTETVFRHFGGSKVSVGINTYKEDASAFARHYRRGGTYHIYRSFGAALDRDAGELAEILAIPDRAEALARFRIYLTGLYQTVTHELNHVLNEHPDDLTHDPKFYRDQAEMMLRPEILKGQAEKWFDELAVRPEPVEGQTVTGGDPMLLRHGANRALRDPNAPRKPGRPGSKPANHKDETDPLESKPQPKATMLKRVERGSRLEELFIELSGGKPITEISKAELEGSRDAEGLSEGLLELALGRLVIDIALGRVELLPDLDLLFGMVEEAEPVRLYSGARGWTPTGRFAKSVAEIARSAPEFFGNAEPAPAGDYSIHYSLPQAFFDMLPKGKSISLSVGGGIEFFARPIPNIKGCSMRLDSGATVTFTGRIFGQGSTGTVYEARLGNGRDPETTVAVRIADHPEYFADVLDYKAPGAEKDVEMLAYAADKGVGRARYLGRGEVDGMRAVVSNVAPGEHSDVVDPGRINRTTIEELIEIYKYLQNDVQFTVDREGHVYLVDPEGANRATDEAPDHLISTLKDLAGRRRKAGLTDDFIQEAIARVVSDARLAKARERLRRLGEEGAAGKDTRAVVSTHPVDKVPAGSDETLPSFALVPHGGSGTVRGRLVFDHRSGVEIGRKTGEPAGADIMDDGQVVVRLPEGGVSRRHFRIYYRDGAWWIVDLGSTNRTYINDNKKPLEELKPTRINPMDRIHIGGPSATRIYSWDFMLAPAAKAEASGPANPGAAAARPPAYAWETVLGNANSVHPDFARESAATLVTKDGSRALVDLRGVKEVVIGSNPGRRGNAVTVADGAISSPDSDVAERHIRLRRVYDDGGIVTYQIKDSSGDDKRTEVNGLTIPKGKWLPLPDGTATIRIGKTELTFTAPDEFLVQRDAEFLDKLIAGATGENRARAERLQRAISQNDPAEILSALAELEPVPLERDGLTEGLKGQRDNRFAYPYHRDHSRYPDLLSRVVEAARVRYSRRDDRVGLEALPALAKRAGFKGKVDTSQREFPKTRAFIGEHVDYGDYRPDDPVRMLEDIIHPTMTGLDDNAVVLVDKPGWKEAVLELVTEVEARLKSGQLKKGELRGLPIMELAELAKVQFGEAASRDIDRLLNRSDAEILAVVQRYLKSDVGRPVHLPRPPHGETRMGLTRALFYFAAGEGGRFDKTMTRIIDLREADFRPAEPLRGARQAENRRWIVDYGGIGGWEGMKRLEAHDEYKARLYFAVRPDMVEAFWNALRKEVLDELDGVHDFQAKISNDADRFRSGEASVFYFRSAGQKFSRELVTAFARKHPEFFHEFDADTRPLFAAQLYDGTGPGAMPVRGVSVGQNPRSGSFNSMRGMVAIARAIRNERLLEVMGRLDGINAEQRRVIRKQLIFIELERVGVDPENPAFEMGGDGIERGIERFHDLYLHTDQGGAGQPGGPKGSGGPEGEGPKRFDKTIPSFRPPSPKPESAGGDPMLLKHGANGALRDPNAPKKPGRTGSKPANHKDDLDGSDLGALPASHRVSGEGVGSSAAEGRSPEATLARAVLELSFDTNREILDEWDEVAKDLGYSSLEAFIMQRIGYELSTLLPIDMRAHKVEPGEADIDDGDIPVPSPESAGRLIAAAKSAVIDYFPELEITSDMPEKIVADKIFAFLERYRAAEMIFQDGGLRKVHCVDSSNRIKNLLTAKGFEVLAVWVDMIKLPGSRVHQAEIARIIEAVKEATGLEYELLGILLNLFVRGMPLKGFRTLSSDQIGRLHSILDGLPPEIRGLLAVVEVQPHRINAVKLGGRWYFIDINAQQFGPQYDRLVLVPADRARNAGILTRKILDEYREDFYEQVRPFTSEYDRQQRIIREYMRAGLPAEPLRVSRRVRLFDLIGIVEEVVVAEGGDKLSVVAYDRPARFVDHHTQSAPYIEVVLYLGGAQIGTAEVMVGRDGKFKINELSFAKTGQYTESARQAFERWIAIQPPVTKTESAGTGTRAPLVIFEGQVVDGDMTEVTGLLRRHIGGDVTAEEFLSGLRIDGVDIGAVAIDLTSVDGVEGNTLNIHVKYVKGSNHNAATFKWKMRSLAEGDGSVFAFDFTVHPDLREGGVGTRLAAKRLEYLRSLGYTRMEITVGDKGGTFWPERGYDFEDSKTLGRVIEEFKVYLKKTYKASAEVLEQAGKIRHSWELSRFTIIRNGKEARAGREFLDDPGLNWTAVFDLREGSESWKVLREKLGERATAESGKDRKPVDPADVDLSERGTLGDVRPMRGKKPLGVNYFDGLAEGSFLMRVVRDVCGMLDKKPEELTQSEADQLFRTLVIRLRDQMKVRATPELVEEARVLDGLKERLEGELEIGLTDPEVKKAYEEILDMSAEVDVAPVAGFMARAGIKAEGRQVASLLADGLARKIIEENVSNEGDANIELRRLLTQQAEQFGGIEILRNEDMPALLSDVFAQIYSRFLSRHKHPESDAELLRAHLRLVARARSAGFPTIIDPANFSSALKITKMPGLTETGSTKVRMGRPIVAQEQEIRDLLSTQPKDLSTFFVELQERGELEAFLDRVLEDDSAVAMLSYWEKWLRSEHRTLIEKKISAKKQARAKEGGLPLGIDRKYSPDEQDVIARQIAAIQPTFGCSKACPRCGVDAVPGKKEDIPFDQYEKLFEMHGQRIGANRPPLTWANEPADYSNSGKTYRDLHEVAERHAGYSPEVRTREHEDEEWLRWVAEQDRAGMSVFGLDSTEVDRIRAVVGPNFKLIGEGAEHYLGIGTTSRDSGPSVSGGVGCSDGVVLTPRGLYNVVQIAPVSDRYPQGMIIEPIASIAKEDVKAGDDLHEILRTSVVVFNAMSSNLRPFFTVYRNGKYFDFTVDQNGRVRNVGDSVYVQFEGVDADAKRKIVLAQWRKLGPNHFESRRIPYSRWSGPSYFRFIATVDDSTGKLYLTSGRLGTREGYLDVEMRIVTGVDIADYWPETAEPKLENIARRIGDDFEIEVRLVGEAETEPGRDPEDGPIPEHFRANPRVRYEAEKPDRVGAKPSKAKAKGPHDTTPPPGAAKGRAHPPAAAAGRKLSPAARAALDPETVEFIEEVLSADKMTDLMATHLLRALDAGGYVKVLGIFANMPDVRIEDPDSKDIPDKDRMPGKTLTIAHRHDYRLRELIKMLRTETRKAAGPDPAAFANVEELVFRALATAGELHYLIMHDIKINIGNPVATLEKLLSDDNLSDARDPAGVGPAVVRVLVDYINDYCDSAARRRVRRLLLENGFRSDGTIHLVDMMASAGERSGPVGLIRPPKDTEARMIFGVEGEIDADGEKPERRAPATIPYPGLFTPPARMEASIQEAYLEPAQKGEDDMASLFNPGDTVRIGFDSRGDVVASAVADHVERIVMVLAPHVDENGNGWALAPFEGMPDIRMRHRPAGEDRWIGVERGRIIQDGDIIEVNGKQLRFGVVRSEPPQTIGPAEGVSLADCNILLEAIIDDKIYGSTIIGSRLRNPDLVEVGRNEGDIRFRNHQNVSRRHARLHRIQDTWFIENLSQYDTYIMRAGADKWKLVPPEGAEVLKGDKIRLGPEGPELGFMVLKNLR